MNKIPKILVTGSIAYDRIMNFDGYFKDNIIPNQIHNLNISFFVHKLRESYGGTAGNIAYNLSLLGIKPHILTNVGTKDFKNYETWLKKNNINTSLIKKIKDQHTASAYIITDKNDNQIAGFYPGAMLKQINYKINLRDIDLAIVSPQNPLDMVKLPKLFRKNKTPYIFDPGQQTAILTGENLKSCINGSRMLVGNDYEISLICKKTNLSINQLLKNTEIIIQTLGANGSIIHTKEKTYKIAPAIAKNTCDPTGAGDAYRAGVIKGLIENWSLEKLGKFAGVVSAYTVEKHGTQTHKFNINSIKNRYYKNFKEKI